VVIVSSGSSYLFNSRGLYKLFSLKLANNLKQIYNQCAIIAFSSPLFSTSQGKKTGHNFLAECISLALCHQAMYFLCVFFFF